jgi:hypothetical protein
MISAIMFNVSLVVPLSHNGLLIELAGSKEVIFLSARRNSRAYSCLTARGGGLPWFNYVSNRIIMLIIAVLYKIIVATQT